VALLALFVCFSLCSIYSNSSHVGWRGQSLYTFLQECHLGQVWFQWFFMMPYDDKSSLYPLGHVSLKKMEITIKFNQTKK
jgi:hypothetical protein